MNAPQPIHAHRHAHPVDAACEQLGGISKASFYKLVASGSIETFKVGRRRFVSDEALRKFIANRSMPARG